MSISLTYKGKLTSGKNQIRTAIVGGRMIRFPNANFKRWRADFQGQVLRQYGRLNVAFPVDFVALRVDYWPGDMIKRDCTGMMDALFHALEGRNGGCMVADDAQFKAVVFVEHWLDRKNPRAILKLDAWRMTSEAACE